MVVRIVSTHQASLSMAHSWHTQSELDTLSAPCHDPCTSRMRMLTVVRTRPPFPLAATTLREIGLQGEITFDGGMKAWHEATYPLVSD